MLNEELVAKQKVSKLNQILIKKLHKETDITVNCLQQASDIKDIKREFKKWTVLQYRLQELWNFELDITKHQGYLLPHCTCPTLDNNDIGSHYYISSSCPLHGVTNVLKQQRIV